MKKISIKVGKKGWLIIYTHGLYPEHIEKFKEIIGDPMNTKWYIFPSEYVKKVEYVGQWRLVDIIKAIVYKIKRWLYR